MKITKKSKTNAIATPTPASKPAGVASAPATSPTAAASIDRTQAPVRSAEPKPAKRGPVSLELVQPGAKSVFVAGTFNHWKPETTPLAPAGNGRWVGDLEVGPGRYEYLFVVDGQWLPDPNARETVQNPYGGQNCVLTVSA